MLNSVISKWSMLSVLPVFIYCTVLGWPMMMMVVEFLVFVLFLSILDPKCWTWLESYESRHYNNDILQSTNFDPKSLRFCFKTFLCFLMVSVSKFFGIDKSTGIGFKNFWYRKSIGFGFEKFWYRKKYRYRFRKFLYWKMAKITLIVRVFLTNATSVNILPFGGAVWGDI